jgi:hypothetical protein
MKEIIDDGKCDGHSCKNVSDIPEHALQDINVYCSEILLKTLVKDGNPLSPNIAFGALQKALAILIAAMFPKDMMPALIDELAKSLLKNAQEWSNVDFSKIQNY